MRRLLPAPAAALAALVLAAPVLPGAAAAAEPPRVHALVGARVVTAPGQVLDSGTLVLRDGVIEAVGADVEPPADARVWQLEGMTLYPGLIESFAVRDWPEPEEGEAPQGGHDNPRVRPERHMLRHAFDDNQRRKLRQVGFTTAVLAPGPGIFRGRSVLVNLGDGPVNDNLLRADVAQNLRLQAAGRAGGYPVSTMGAVALVRQTLYSARWHAAAHTAYDMRPAQARPPHSTALGALEPAAEGEAPVVLESGDVLDSLRLAEVVEEFGLDAVLVGNGEEYQRLDAIAAAGLPHLLPVDFPKAPKVDADDPLEADLEALRHWQLAPENPRRLLDAGVTVALTSHRLADPAKLHERVATAVERGLDRDRALAALTTTPARLWGLAERAGTLEAGKMGNVLVVEGELFTEDAKVRSVWIDGRHYEAKAVKPPTVEPAGTWELVIEAGPGGQIPVTLELAGPVDGLSGTVGSQGGTLPLASAEVSGDTVEIAFDSTPFGMPGTITFTLTIDGDSATGSGTSPQGPFTLTGERTRRPDPEVRR